MESLSSSQDYNKCVAHCKSLFPNNEAALVACINGCAKVHSSSDAGMCGHESSIGSELEKMGREHYSSQLRIAAKKAFSDLPDKSEVDKLDPMSRMFVQRISDFVHAGIHLDETDDDALLRIISESSWIKLTADLAGAVMARMNDSGGTGGGKTCATQCLDEYNKCMAENDCEYSIICLCCVPCSFQYGGCMARCVVGMGGLSRGIA